VAEFFVMPQASPTMTVGVVAKWVAAEGAELAPQSVIAQVETDKATMDIEVFDKGVMLKHLAKEGEEVPPGQPIAIIGKAAGEDVSALVAEFEKQKAVSAQPSAVSKPAAAPPQETEAPANVATKAAEIKPPQPGPEASAVPAQRGDAAHSSPRPAQRGEGPGVRGVVPTITWQGQPVDASIMEPLGPYVAAGPRVVASPLAKAMAADKGVDLKRVKGSGPGGRIVAADVEAGPAARGGGARRADEAVRVTQMRKTISRRLTEVHQQVPVFYLTVDLDAAALVKLRKVASDRGVRVSYNDLVLKAVAAALVDVPECNAAWNGDTIVRKGGVDVGVAVALPEGLITPVVRDADRKSVREIADEVRELAGRAKEGKLAVEEYTGGSFSVSNLGMFDIEHFTAILNPPEAAILAVGGVLQVPVVENGQLAVGWRMKVTMTCDHRVIDGALGARFLRALRGYVEAPALMVL
jgi:pyruvate dehydrogenase E2 component (dihydrolipoamide acetyltransferase)